MINFIILKIDAKAFFGVNIAAEADNSTIADGDVKVVISNGMRTIGDRKFWG